MEPLVRVELTIQIYLSLYFPFKNFMDDTAFLKRNIQRKTERKRFKVDFPDNCNDPPHYDDNPLITSAILFYFVFLFLEVCARVYKGNKHI
jgi:hypothetical protein